MREEANAVATYNKKFDLKVGFVSSSGGGI